MFKAQSTQVIAVFIDGELYCCFQPDFSIADFKAFMASFIGLDFISESDIKLLGLDYVPLCPDSGIDLGTGLDFRFIAMVGEDFSYEITFSCVYLVNNIKHANI
jgi:hypothetical protein